MIARAGPAPRDVASEARGSSQREWAGLALLLALGLGPRLALAAWFPTLPFWDSLQLIHFGTLLQKTGLASSGWYWAQFNAGLPMILAALFSLFPGDPTVVARTATAVATGLLPAIPFLVWRAVLPFRWRLVTGALLALWPGQVLFSGVVLQDNWIMLPAVALGSLAARRQMGGSPAHPVFAGLLYAAGVAIRQEMLVVLLPLVLAASLGCRERLRRNLALLGLTVGMALLGLCTQRSAATGRFSLSTEHGALGLFGSFMPGASAPGWIDARGYAASLAPEAPPKLFGDQPTLLRLTREEVLRRPAFHALRIATWLPRLAINADADSLLWSLSHPRAQSPDRQSPARQLASGLVLPLTMELAIVQGLFLGCVLLGWKGRNRAILVLASAVLLKFLVHMIVSPLGRLVMPAVALELLVIPLGLYELSRGTARERLAFLAVSTSAAVLLLFAVPRLALAVTRQDPPIERAVTPRPSACARPGSTLPNRTPS